jgi:hypothetical protein
MRTSSEPLAPWVMRLATFGVAVALALAATFPAETVSRPCKSTPATNFVEADAVAEETDVPEEPAGSEAPPAETRGIGLAVRIWNVRIEFPWLKHLPVSPGWRVVVTLFESDSRESR